MKAAIVIGFALAFAVSGVVASIIVRYEISSQMRVKPTVSMGVFDTDGVTPLRTLNFGDVTWNTWKKFPGGTDQTPTEYYFINNTDQVDFYVSMTVENMPAGITTYINFKRGDQSTFWNTGVSGNGTTDIYHVPLISKVNTNDTALRFAFFYISLEIIDPAFGTYTPTIWINAHDSD